MCIGRIRRFSSGEATRHFGQRLDTTTPVARRKVINLPFSEWSSVFPKARFCKALLDRITDRAHIVETGTESYRFRHTMERKAKKRPDQGWGQISPPLYFSSSATLRRSKAAQP
jgi:hypothetical protein